MIYENQQVHIKFYTDSFCPIFIVVTSKNLLHGRFL